MQSFCVFKQLALDAAVFCLSFTDFKLKKKKKREEGADKSPPVDPNVQTLQSVMYSLVEQTNGTWQAFAAADTDGVSRDETCEGIQGLFVPKIAKIGGGCTFECGSKVLLKKGGSAVFLEGFVPPKGKAQAIVLQENGRDALVCDAHELVLESEQVALAKIPPEIYLEAVKKGREKIVSGKDGRVEKKIVTVKGGDMIYTAEDYQNEVEKNASLRSSLEEADKKYKQLEGKCKELRKKVANTEELKAENLLLKEENARLKGLVEGMQTTLRALGPVLAVPGPKSEEFEGTDLHQSARKRGRQARRSLSDEEDNNEDHHGHSHRESREIHAQVEKLEKKLKKLKKQGKGSRSDSE